MTNFERASNIALPYWWFWYEHLNSDTFFTDDEDTADIMAELVGYV